MRFRALVFLAFIVFVEVFLIFLRLGGSVEVLVGAATVTALIFPLYPWEREQLDRRIRLVDEVRVCVDHFYYIGEGFQQIAPNEVKPQEIGEFQRMSAEIAGRLAEALARCVALIGSDTVWATKIRSFISDLRKFARDEGLLGDFGLFEFHLKKLLPVANEIGNMTSLEIDSRFKVRHLVRNWLPLGLAERIILATLVGCFLVLVFLIF
jgi:hypothetical protein